MPPSFLSIASLYGRFIRRSFIAAGLSPKTIHVDDEITVHFWCPNPNPNPKPALVLIHGFGPMAAWQWQQQVKFFSPHFHVYVSDLIFFGGSTTTSTERSEIFQAALVGKLLDKLQVERFHVMGTSYVRWLCILPKGPESGHCHSSGVNVRMRDNAALLERAQLDDIEKLMLPSTPDHLMAVSVFNRVHMVPHFFLNDFVNKFYSDNRKEKMELLIGV